MNKSDINTLIVVATVALIVLLLLWLRNKINENKPSDILHKTSSVNKQPQQNKEQRKHEETKEQEVKEYQAKSVKQESSNTSGKDRVTIYVKDTKENNETSNDKGKEINSTDTKSNETYDKEKVKNKLKGF